MLHYERRTETANPLSQELARLKLKDPKRADNTAIVGADVAGPAKNRTPQGVKAEEQETQLVGGNQSGYFWLVVLC